MSQTATVNANTEFDMTDIW